MAKESGKSKGKDERPKTDGIPLGINVSPSKESHQKGNRGAGVFTWRSGRGAA